MFKCILLALATKTPVLYIHVYGYTNLLLSSIFTFRPKLFFSAERKGMYDLFFVFIYFVIIHLFSIFNEVIEHICFWAFSRL